AAIATTLALTVLEPESTGIGGGGFLLEAGPKGQLSSIDGREEAPAAARADWFVKDGKVLGFRDAVLGGRSVGVPGLLRLMELAHKKHGKLAWSVLFQPAIRMARDGFPMSDRLHGALSIFQASAVFDPASRALYFDPAGQPLAAGTIIRNPALAKLMQDLAKRGAAAYYTGPHARAIVAAVNGASRNPAPMTMADLAQYKAKIRAPICGKYRQYRICSMAPPASGAITLLQILGQLERFDLAKGGAQSPLNWHLFAESTRLAFADRGQYIGDLDYVSVPITGLIAPDYIAARSALISDDKTMENAPAGNPTGAKPSANAQPSDEHGTSHVSAADRFGHVASFTSTIESGFGSGLVVDGTYLNNELTDFDLDPPSAGQSTANQIAAHKRPRSAMTPVVAYGPDGHIAFVIGAGGGATIVVQVAKAIIGVVDWGLSFDQAIALPLVFAPTTTVMLEQGTSAEMLAPALTTLGHTARPMGMRLKANAAYWDGKVWQGAADQRSEGVTVKE
ncbi:MAG: hypothetical protein RLY97_303, partial [Pseudomonadota bacterium]